MNYITESFYHDTSTEKHTEYVNNRNNSNNNNIVSRVC